MRSNIGLHPIKIVALKTGLSPHLIRVWEKRYGAVTPGRTETQRRLYSEEEIERLKLLQLLTGAGHSIGSIANLELAALRSLVETGSGENRPDVLVSQKSERKQTGRKFVDRCLAAVVELDQSELETALQEASMTLGQQGMLVHVVAPLVAEVGALWQDGTIGVAHEHFASGVLRTVLGTMSRPFAPSEAAPHIIVATPPGQLHELGALMVAAAASAMGWQATYLGAGLGAVEMASVLGKKPARAVALSLVYPADDPALAAELRRVRALIPAEVALMVGGSAAAAHEPLLNEIGAIYCGGPLKNFMDRLQELRSGNS